MGTERGLILMQEKSRSDRGKKTEKALKPSDASSIAPPFLKGTGSGGAMRALSLPYLFSLPCRSFLFQPLFPSILCASSFASVRRERSRPSEASAMTTLDNKLLGEKLQYYYSSSEDEESEKEEGSAESHSVHDAAMPKEVALNADGSAINTGPKGVINDWRRFKQLETEQREEQCREMERLIKTLSVTCRSHLDEEKDKQKQKELREKLNDKLALHEGADDEQFLQQYRQQRMEEMRRQLHPGQQFMRVFEIRSGEAFLDTVDKGNQKALVMIHIYEGDVPGSEALDGCMLCLATEYPTVKFCRVRSSLLGTSSRFTSNALPALLVYKGGELIGNFIRITDQLGEDFFAADLEAFLQECSLLPEKDVLLFPAICSAAPCYNADSDLDID